ncbi:phenazine biosynthesis-like domain-containing protein [Haliotis rufescens]|uniref:phenazine biosynthesis-like domain-containing protein n=1 Tax=Haliotis rufescens TaxID=6454 RepID=UPI00201EDA44|nr:phenazine biosynthesis-like domain-containing protein [Haliotis rufescens]
MALSLRMFVVDTFADEAFKGNPAPICLLPLGCDLTNTVMQEIASELGMGETTFVQPISESGTFQSGMTFKLRSLTRSNEARLCGHGALGSAAVLFRKMRNTNACIVFKTFVGDLFVKQEDEYFSLDLPIGHTVKEELRDHSAILSALGDVPGVRDVAYCQPLRFLLVRLQDGWSRHQFESWQPDIGSIETSTNKLRVLIITTRGSTEEGYVDKSGAPYDFVSRCFSPWTSSREDAVTGSAQTVLAHYWSQQLGKTDFHARQCSKRGGDIIIRLRDDRVEILGKARFTMDITLTLDKN